MSKPCFLFLAAFLGISLAASQAPAAQAPASAKPLAFEVASIKPSPDLSTLAAAGGMPHVGTKIDAARVDIGMTSLAQLICAAYDVKPYQVDGPDWIKSARFDILAKMPDGATKEQVPAMLQTLLAQRFGLVFHRDSKDESVYALVVGKDGLKLQPAAPDAPPSDAPPPPPAKGETVYDTGAGQVRIQKGADGANTASVTTDSPVGPVKMTMASGGMHLQAAKMSMAQLAQALSPFLDRPVVDATGLAGNYQVALDLSMQDMMAAARNSGVMAGMGPAPGADAGASDPSGHSVFASVQQLGLRLDSRKAPIPLIVVDHLEKSPTAN